MVIYIVMCMLRFSSLQTSGWLKSQGHLFHAVNSLIHFPSLPHRYYHLLCVTCDVPHPVKGLLLTGNSMTRNTAVETSGYQGRKLCSLISLGIGLANLNSCKLLCKDTLVQVFLAKSQCNTSYGKALLLASLNQSRIKSL